MVEAHLQYLQSDLIIKKESSRMNVHKFNKLGNLKVFVVNICPNGL